MKSKKFWNRMELSRVIMFLILGLLLSYIYYKGVNEYRVIGILFIVICLEIISIRQEVREK